MSATPGETPQRLPLDPLALRRDGKPLGEAQGPVRLIVPADPKHARWIKKVATVRLVRLDKLVTAP